MVQLGELKTDVVAGAGVSAGVTLSHNQYITLISNLISLYHYHSATACFFISFSLS